MHPRAGDTAPDFDAVSDDGRHIRLSELRGSWVVLFFYPKAGTPGCSVESQGFQATLPEFQELRAHVIGVSTDTEASQAKFRDQCGLTFPLLPDGDKRISRAYGVLRGVTGLLGLAARHTYLIDPDGRIARHWNKVNYQGHAAEVLEDLQHRLRADARTT